ncbi:hypothetical protein BU16DRAFT_566748 [Lophium mytilinum]|uniref:Uncharacterized protein n=1 Tax=Lophium mytilinum TaxID=390894 RepID=A0A6A6QBJ5_9PEZI|nr:hypothetical protein BU16DRAFT_566748 [Lophium mytilinum]
MSSQQAAPPVATRFESSIGNESKVALFELGSTSPSRPAPVALDDRQQSQLNTMGYDHLRYPAPHFSNPWRSGPAAPSSQMYPASGLEKFEGVSQQHVQRPTSLLLPFHNLPVTAPPLGSGISLSDGTFGSQNLLHASQDLLNPARTYSGNSSASPNAASYAPTSAPKYLMDYSNNSRKPYAYQQDSLRQLLRNSS